MTEPTINDPEDRPTRVRASRPVVVRPYGPTVKGFVLNLLSLALVVAVVSFFAAPAVAFFGIRAASKVGDVGGLTRLIDYDAVRASLKPQLSGRPEPLTPTPSFLQDPMGAVRRQFDRAVTPTTLNAPDVEAYLSPQALYNLSTGWPAQDTRLHDAALPRPIYWSVNRARVAMDSGTPNQPLVFTFERRGPFEWKLVHIGLPKGAWGNWSDETVGPASRTR